MFVVYELMYFVSKMDMDLCGNPDYKEQLRVEDTDGSCTTECVSGDWFREYEQENLAVLKHEPDAVCCVICRNQ